MPLVQKLGTSSRRLILADWRLECVEEVPNRPLEMSFETHVGGFAIHGWDEETGRRITG